MSVLAGIVTFNPDLDLLKNNIDSVLPQVDSLVIVDNHSENIHDIRKLCTDKVHIISNESNRGIAYALNKEFFYAMENGHKWVLTLDQDTVVPSNILSEYKKYYELDKIGMLSCRIQDRNLFINQTESIVDSEYISDCITSGSLLKVDAWNKVKGFCDEMFIDAVDHDMCFSLIEQGYKILRVNSVILNHAVGESKFIVSFGKRYQLYNESPLRNYYQFRNSIYLLKRHKRMVLSNYKYGLLGFVLSRIVRAYLIVRYEEDSLHKLCMIIKGTWHGLIGKYGKYK